ncbi:hypothetical protein [Silvibacterium acidisoli]|uniref:hypothetical protein n=1 Tax=Acidobacteriaceae bacterium ZG23-2 TaxID=2883246 RepID=UPI00406C33C6
MQRNFKIPAKLRRLGYLLLALLVLSWGTASKVSLYHVKLQGGKCPLAKLLSEAERANAPSVVPGTLDVQWPGDSLNTTETWSLENPDPVQDADRLHAFASFPDNHSPAFLPLRL